MTPMALYTQAMTSVLLAAFITAMSQIHTCILFIPPLHYTYTALLNEEVLSEPQPEQVK